MREGQTIADVLEGRADWIVVTGDWPKATRIPPTGWAAERNEKPTVRAMLARLPKVGDVMRVKDCAPTSQQRKRIRWEVASDERFKVTRSGRAFVIVRVA